MEISFVTSHLTVFGGAGKFLMNYANKFAEKGYKVSVIAQKIDQKKYNFNNNIKLIEVGGHLPSHPLFWLRFYDIKKRYIKALSQMYSDIIFSQMFPANYYCSCLEKKYYRKNIYYCFEPYRYFHDKLFYSRASLKLRIITRILRKIFKKYDISGVKSADAIISISNFIQKRVKLIYQRDSFVHYIGISVNNFQFQKNKDLRAHLGINEDIPLIFTLGLSHHLKGVKEMLFIFKRILEKCPRTILLIGGWILQYNKDLMDKLIKKLKIPLENIILYGFINKNDLKYFYSTANLTIYTPIDESFGLIPLESMICGTPVVSFEGGPSETIKNGKTGFIIKKNDLNDFSEKVVKLLIDRNLQEKFSKETENHIRENFTLKKSSQNLELFFRRILNI